MQRFDISDIKARTKLQFFFVPANFVPVIEKVGVRFERLSICGTIDGQTNGRAETAQPTSEPAEKRPKNSQKICN